MKAVCVEMLFEVIITNPRPVVAIKILIGHEYFDEQTILQVGFQVYLDQLWERIALPLVSFFKSLDPESHRR